ncbi:MAG: histidine kinase [Actinomycetales bacterium]|nr:histidine kinase [Actinomycetales bacterium]
MSRAGQPSIRTRVLAIALVPSIALLLVGIGVTGYLAREGKRIQDSSTTSADAAAPAALMIAAIQAERLASLRKMVNPQGGPGELPTLRKKVDTELVNIGDVATALSTGGSPELREALAGLDRVVEELPDLREQVDSGGVAPLVVYQSFNRYIDIFTAVLTELARSAPDVESAYEKLVGAELFAAAEGMARSTVLRSAILEGGGLRRDLVQEYNRQIVSYHTALESLVPRMTPGERAMYTSLTSSSAWATIVAVEDAVTTAGFAANAPGAGLTAASGRNLPQLPGAQTLRTATTEVTTALLQLYVSHSAHASDLAATTARNTFVRALLSGFGLLLLALLVFVIALQLSNVLVRRLSALRSETLALADEKLPALVDRLRRGERVDLEAELPPLDHGGDEIGQVAEAFTKAQRTAVDAAAQEAATRTGTRLVFLNIARRSQAVVHRQLELLDQAERTQEDPDQLGVLFQLDHLATRSRRNAENLIILAGEQPGRRWRKPVSLVQVVRSAIAETEQYTRVATVRLPGCWLDGTVVADLVHIVAELVDNAVVFGPPTSRVEVRGNVVGRGVVIEVEDQGIGIAPDQLGRLNAMLRAAPDFSIMALADEPRLGLFVVARLAARHGIQVTLSESPIYGGTRAVVLIPSTLIAETPTAEGDLRIDLDRAAAQLPAGQRMHGRRQQLTAPATVPAGPVSVGPVSVGPVSAGALTSGTAAGTVPTGTVPTGTVPTGTVPTGTVPAVTVASGTVASGTVASGTVASGTATTDAMTPSRATGAVPSTGPVPPTGAVSTEAVPPAAAEGGATPAGRGSGGAGAGNTHTDAVEPSDLPYPMTPAVDRPALPRRTRQANLAPQLRDEGRTAEAETDATADLWRSAEQARARYAAIQRGTRQARSDGPRSPLS